MIVGAEMGPHSEASWRDLAQLSFDKVVTIGDVAPAPDVWQMVGQPLFPWHPDVAMPTAAEGIPWLAMPEQTATDIHSWAEKQLRLWLTTHLPLFIGCRLEEAVIKRCYFYFDRERATNQRRNHRPGGWALLSAYPLQRSYWEQQGLRLVVGDPANWIANLRQGWQAQVREMTGPQPLPAGVQPYRFLQAYQEEDAGRFFGREKAIRDLGELTLAERLVVCFGPSGAGKSSLLKAGVTPLLRRQGYLPLYCRPAGDPLHAARQTVLTQLAAQPGGVESLAKLLTRLAGEKKKPIVLLFDQFEELFTLSGPQVAQKLAVELAACLHQPDLAVRIVLSLREDFLARLDELRPGLPQIFAHRYRVRPLQIKEARAAIERPAELCGLRYEPLLTERLLADLAKNKESISPADLQIVCGTLYEAVRQRQGETFRLSDYQALGGMEEILGGYLERVVAAEAEPVQVQAVLKTLVTAQGTKVALPLTEIGRLADLPLDTVQAILARLDQPHRLVRPLQREQTTWYELTHEIVGPRILAWLTGAEERQALVVHDLLRAEQASWQQIDVIPGPGQVQFVYEQRQNPHLHLSQDDLNLLLRGALAHGVEPTYWLEQAADAGVVGEDLLAESLKSPVAQVRRRAAALLSPGQAIDILRAGLDSADPEQRIAAAETLAGINQRQAWSALRRHRYDTVEAVRIAVWNSLTSMHPVAALRLWRQDQAAPLLVAGTAVYGLGLVAYREALATPVDWLVAGGIWLAALLILLTLSRYWPLADEAADVAADEEPRASRRLSSWLSRVVWIGILWLVVAVWGWWGGVALWLVLAWGIRGRLSLAWWGLLPFLPWFFFLPLTPLTIGGVTAVMIMILSLLCLAVPRWGRYGADRLEALTVLAAGLAGAGGGWLAAPGGVGVEGVVAGLLLGSVISVGRLHARRGTTLAGGDDTGAMLADIGRAFWDILDEISLSVKPLLEGTLAAVWGALLLRWSAELAGGQSAWSVGGAVWLGLGLGLGLAWGRRGLWRWLLPLVGGAVGGWLGLGLAGALLGGCLGVGLAVGEVVVMNSQASSAPESENGAQVD